MTRIAIIGAGAIGSILGALLCRAEQDVTVVGRSAHMAAIRRDGLQLEGALGSLAVRLATAEALDFRPDLALLTVKTQDVLTAVQANMAFLTDVPLVTCQNGVRSDALVASLLPQHQIISAVVNIHANYLRPGTVTLLYRGPLVIGRPFGSNDAQVDAAAALLRLAVPTSVSNNIDGAHWLKLIVNLNNALPALTNMTIHQLYTDPYVCQMAVQVMREGLRVVRAAGIRLESLPDTPTTLIRLMGWLPVRLAARVLAAKAHSMETMWPLLGSTLQSLRRSRPTEINYLNGEIVRLGQQLSVPTPLNATVVEMVHHVEQTGQFWTVDAIRSAISGGLHILPTVSR